MLFFVMMDEKQTTRIKETIMIKTIDASYLPQIKRLYEDAGWVAYLKDEAKFITMLENSLTILGYFEGDKLVGTIRAVGDQAHILYIQDILVLTTHSRKGIGSKLLKALCSTYDTVRQKVLITDKDDSTAHAFYKHLGFKAAEEVKTTCFIRYD